MKVKRIFAYIIDYLIVSFIAALLFAGIPAFKESNEELLNKTDEYIEVMTTSGSSEIDADYELQYLYDSSRAMIPMNVISCGLMLLYFGVFAYISNGQTLGKKIFKIKVVSDKGSKPNPNAFMIRTVIITNIIPSIASILCTLYLSKSNWLVWYNITSYISELVIFLILGFMIIRDDEKGLHDIICKTNVVEAKK